MIQKILSKRSVAILMALSLLFIVGLVAYPKQQTGHNQELALAAPPFIQVAHAGVPEIAEMLDDEAGISAWYQAPGTIDLDLVRDEFTTIELDTGEYIVGSVAAPNYPEHYDVHIYVHQDGWILAYYLQNDPVAKIVDVRAQSLDTTILKNVVAVVAGAAGMPVTSVNYYDFRYPNATNILLIAELISNGNDFTIQIPSIYGYFEYSWSLWNGAGGAYFRLNGTNMTSIYYDGTSGYGTLTTAQFLPDITHTITVDDYGVLAIVYRVP